MFQNHDESDRYSNAYLVGEGCESFIVFDNVDVSGLILDTITELGRRKLEENSRLYYPPREEQTVPYVYILPKNGSVFKVRYINIGYSIGKSLGGCDTDQLEIIMVKTSGRWDIITAYPCS